jgi:hypothetical protein
MEVLPPCINECLNFSRYGIFFEMGANDPASPSRPFFYGIVPKYSKFCITDQIRLRYSRIQKLSSIPNPINVTQYSSLEKEVLSNIQ